MNILVLIKPVPDPEHEKEIRIDEASGRLVRDGVPAVIDQESRNALEAALEIAHDPDAEQGNVCVLAMAPPDVKDKLTEALAMGADEAYLLSDKAFGGADTYATSYTLACAVKKIEETKSAQFDLILAGSSSLDGGTAHVPVQVAEWLNRARLTKVCRLETDGDRITAVRRSEEAMQRFEGTGPAVISVTRDSNKPRLVTAMGIIKARKKPLIVWNAEDLGIDLSKTGIEGSPTKPGKMAAPEDRRAGDDLGEDIETAAAGIIQIIRKAGL